MNETELLNFTMALKDDNCHIRRKAISDLGSSPCNGNNSKLIDDTNSKKIISILINALNNTDKYFRLLAAEALTSIDWNF